MTTQKIAIVSNDSFHDLRDEFIRQLSSLFGTEKEPCTVKFFTCKEAEIISRELSDYTPDILITENMAGFHMETLMDSIFYNTMFSRQFHFLLDDSWKSPSKKELLKKPLSLGMSFLVLSDEDKKELLTLNPDIPYVQVISAYTPEVVVYTISKLLNITTV
jgi:hypothetical protein